MDDEVVNLLREFVNESGTSSETSSDSDDEEEEENKESGDKKTRKPCPNVSYDTSLPAQHSYLGTDLEELSGRTVLDDNSYQVIPILTLPGVVLVPGQMVPLQLYHPATVSMMHNIINSDRTFGMINSRLSGRAFGSFLDPVGTTAEIRSYRTDDGQSFSISPLKIIAEGRQRFKLLETRRQSDGMIIGKVRILPEISLGCPGDGARMQSLNRFRIPPPVGPRNRKDLTPPVEMFTKRNHGKYNFANYTAIPDFLYKQYDPEILMYRIKCELHGWNDSLRIEYMPAGPREFSFWVASNLPLDDSQRVNLLSVNDVVQRLRIELEILEQCPVLQCRDCHAEVADRKDIFSMSLRGPQGTYVNANGYVHETITLYQARGLSLSGRPSTEQSWFPGYAWTIVECQQCHNHMGWKFTSVEKKKVHPSKFWAFSRSSLTTSMAHPRKTY